MVAPVRNATGAVPVAMKIFVAIAPKLVRRVEIDPASDV